MTRHLSALVVFSLLGVLPSQAKPTFLDAPFWDDGKAEIAVYEAKRFHYGRLYESEIIHYLVKEPFSLTRNVKSNSPKGEDVVPAIKLNQVITTPTGTYTYQQMHSSFWSKSEGRLLKASLSHHEACGNTYKEAIRSGEKLNFLAHTYWEGKSRVEREINLSPTTWTEDELPFQLRRLVADDLPLPDPLLIIPTMMHSKAGSTVPVPATLKRDGFSITVTCAGRDDHFAFDTEWPHVLTSTEKSDGSKMTLKKHLRLDYWNHHQPDDSLTD